MVDDSEGIAGDLDRALDESAQATYDPWLERRPAGDPESVPALAAGRGVNTMSKHVRLGALFWDTEG